MTQWAYVLLVALTGQHLSSSNENKISLIYIVSDICATYLCDGERPTHLSYKCDPD